MKSLYKVTLKGRCPIKKNTARHFGHRVVYSKAYVAWEKIVSGIVRKAKSQDTITEYFEARFTFYLKNKQWEPDLSNVCEGIQDVLETEGIIENDRLIKRLIAEKHFDPDNPRLEVELRALSKAEIAS